MKKQGLYIISLLLLTLTLLLLCASCDHEHVYGQWKVEKEATCAENGNKVRFCECGEKEEQIISSELAGKHSYTSKVTKAATCTKDGVKKFACLICKDTYTETISATGHNWKAATCTKPEICSSCNATNGKALGHNKDSNGYCARCEEKVTFEILKNYIIDNGTYNATDNCYYLILDTSYSSDYSNKYIIRTCYCVSNNEIMFDNITEKEGSFDRRVYFKIDENIDGTYYWCYLDYDNYKMSGTLYATTYIRNTPLYYSYNNILFSDLRPLVSRLASIEISTLCICINLYLDVIDITAYELGFHCFQ